MRTTQHILVGILLAAFMLPTAVFGQIEEPNVVKLPSDKDGTPVFRIDATEVVGEGTGFKGRKRHMKRIKKRNKLRRNIIKVYPIALAISDLVNKVDAKMQNAPSDFKRKRYMKKLERDLKKHHKKDIMSLTMSQGRVLIKLVYRETDNSVYDLIKDHRNSGLATFWFAIGKVFRMDIRNDYDPKKEVAIEQIIREIDKGQLERYEVHNY